MQGGHWCRRKSDAPSSLCQTLPQSVNKNWNAHRITKMQGFIRPVARVGSGDPVRVLRLYTTITLDEVCSIYC